MTFSTTHPIYGKILLDWGFWSGKYTLFFNGTELKKIDKMTFELCDPENGQVTPVILSGNNFKGYNIRVGTEIVQISSKAKWTDMLLGFIPAAIVIFFIQGAIGGGLAGGMAMFGTFTIIACQGTKKKLLACLGLCAVSLVLSLLLSVIATLIYQSLGLL